MKGCKVNAILQKEILTETYEDVKDLIAKIVWNFQTTHGGDFEELLAEANLIFVLAFDTHDETEAQLSTWLYNCINPSLLNYMKEEWRHPTISIDDKNTDTSSLYSSSFSIMDLLDELESDAHVVLHLLLDTPEEIVNIALTKGKAQRHLKAELKRHLHKMGWTMKRITKTFEEIRKVLQR